jgi:hypothetical protein
MTAYAPSTWLPGKRLVVAELLKLRKRRGLVITTALLAAVPPAILFTTLAILHATTPLKHGPAGGVVNLGYGVFVLSLVGGLVATLVGTAAGAGDLNAGVFKELVVTGRSRRALFLARVPGGLAFLLPPFAFMYAAVASFTVASTGSLATPSMRLLALGGAWLLLAIAFWFLLALGISSLVGSRSTTIGVLVAWQLAVGPALAGISAFGVARDAVPGAGLGRIAPAQIRDYAVSGLPVPMSIGAAVVAVALVAGIAVAAGSRRTETRDA